MSHDTARRRASRLTRPAAALGVLSLSALGLTAVPASAEVTTPVDDQTATTAPAAPGAEPTAPVSEGAGPTADAPSEAPAETPVPEDAPVVGTPEAPATETPAAPAENPADPAAGGTEADTAEPVAPTSVNPDGTVTIDLLGITDFHGALEKAPILAGMINQIRVEENVDTVFVSAGDNIGGSTYASAIQEDAPTIDVLNAMGLAASAVGNHEFDQGYADLSGRVADRADWQYLGANVDDENPELEDVHFETVAGLEVAFVGTVTEETPRIVSADGIAGITFADPVARTNAIAAQLSDGDAGNGEADVVVALVHEGTNLVASALSADVDAAFTGHTHVATTAQTPSGAPVVQAGASGSHLGRITLTVAPDGEVTATGTNVAVPADGTRDPKVQQIVVDALAQAKVIGEEQVGSVTAPFNRGTNTGTSDGSNRGVESPLGNLLGEVAKWTAESVGLTPDFGIINPGGIRADLDPNANGVVTYAEAFAVQPFGNTIGTIDLTGEQVVTMLEQQFQPGKSRPVLRLGLSADVDYTYDPTAPQGAHITDVLIGGEPIDLGATYTVASNTFLINGEVQDGFSVFGSGTNFTETGIVDLQGLVNFLQANPDVAPDYTQRSIGLTFVSDTTVEYVGGEEVVIELSSLSFTTNEPKPGFVTLFIDGEEAGQFAVDNTITPGTDETGRATVTFTIPDLADYEAGDVIFFEMAFGATPESEQSIVLAFEVTESGVVLPPTDGEVTPQPAPQPAPGKAPVVTPAAAPATGSLPNTGADVNAALFGAAALMLLGGLTIAVARRRATIG
ncbi:5'-nucleotidase [Georgenia soli]|uniref:5'-nucleotidase n=1 Tax=Georgenia soli TaxID=638953 RepID=A0A2A9ENQ6_9MICO|nr:5'-nucleotidase C-terminal domain-containing protein [Georgenia soli]PFG40226.1 5'-nucleotidase [Georgenia soli]